MDDRKIPHQPDNQIADGRQHGSGTPSKSRPKFTPGPWQAHHGWAHDGPLEGYPEWCEVTGPQRLSITGHCGLANAHLIAAAPEMYKALKLAMSRVNDLEIIINQARELGMTLFLCGDKWPEWKKQIDAALAKANGGAQ